MKMQINPFVVLKKQGGEYFLIQDDEVFHLKGIGIDIWYILQEGVSEEELYTKLLDEYNVESKKLKKDVSKFLNIFKKNNILE